MPTHRYECAAGHQSRIVRGVRDTLPDAIKCKTCKRKATYSFGPPQTSVFEPFVTTVGDGERKHVRNSAEARDIERRFGVLEVGSKEWREMSTPDAMRRRREQRRRDGMASLGNMREDYRRAEAEVSTWGKEYAAQHRRNEQREYETFQREVEAGRVND